MPASEPTVERLLRAHAPHAPETLRERVLALEPTSPSRKMPSRRLVLVALPAALAIAVVAAVVHGIVGSGSRPVASVTTAGQATLSPSTHGGTDSRKVPFQSSNPAPSDSTRRSTAPSVGAPSRLQHTHALLPVRVGAPYALPAAT